MSSAVVWVRSGLPQDQGHGHQQSWEVPVGMCLVTQLCLTLCNCIVHGILQARTLEWVAIPFSRGSSQSRSPAMQADSLPSEPPGKTKNTGVDSLSLLQGMFPTQESNWGLLHCRLILYQLSQKGSPRILEWVAYPISRGSS